MRRPGGGGGEGACVRVGCAGSEGAAVHQPTLALQALASLPHSPCAPLPSHSPSPLTLRRAKARAQHHRQAPPVRRADARVLVPGRLQQRGPAKQHVHAVAFERQPAPGPVCVCVCVCGCVWVCVCVCGGRVWGGAGLRGGGRQGGERPPPPPPPDDRPRAAAARRRGSPTMHKGGRGGGTRAA